MEYNQSIQQKHAYGTNKETIHKKRKMINYDEITKKNMK